MANLRCQCFAVGVLTGCAMALALHLAFRKKRRKKSEPTECLFFSKNFLYTNCNHLCEFFLCSLCNYKKFKDLILNTKTHIDICMYLITSEDFTHILVTLFNKGVVIRIITDKQMSGEANNSKILVFLQNHIPVKLIKNAEMMHNKFIIIDQKLLITGSFNLTKHGIYKNYESGVIIHNSDVVDKFQKYFQYMWTLT